ncbi:MAG: NTP transferase domain-containing protein [Pseudomonadota bacterium]
MIRESISEHPQDVIKQWLDWNKLDRAALAVITKTEGGGVRAPGALMAISENGERAGYVSGGCIDEDVALNALSALAKNEPRLLRYGKGSPFKDVPLPCGGAMEIAILPNANPRVLEKCQLDLAARHPTTLHLSGPAGKISHAYKPKLRVRVAGRGPDAVVLWKLCKAAGFPSELALPETITWPDDKKTDDHQLVKLHRPQPEADTLDDHWTAVVLMLHDTNLEGPLLQQALSGPAFYIGAVGSKRSHEQRCEVLKSAGMTPEQISRVRGPVGLIPSLRNASMLAISTLAEIVDVYNSLVLQPFSRTGLAMLAAGSSSRFGTDDKLLAEVRGEPVIRHGLRALSSERVGMRIGVIGPGHAKRAYEFREHGWDTSENPTPELGLGSSLVTAVRNIEEAPGIDAILVLLADMPFVPDQHLYAMRAAMVPGVQAVMSQVDGILCPPALFSRDVFPQLRELPSDIGARDIFKTLEQTQIIDLSPSHAIDIDIKEDLEALIDGS